MNTVRKKIDTKDQIMMINEGIHPPYREIYDFSKTPK